MLQNALWNEITLQQKQFMHFTFTLFHLVHTEALGFENFELKKIILEKGPCKARLVFNYIGF